MRCPLRLMVVSVLPIIKFFFSSRFIFNDVPICGACVCIGVCIRVHCVKRPKLGIRSPVAGITDDCEIPDLVGI